MQYYDDDSTVFDSTYSDIPMLEYRDRINGLILLLNYLSVVNQ